MTSENIEMIHIGAYTCGFYARASLDGTLSELRLMATNGSAF